MKAWQVGGLGIVLGLLICLLETGCGGGFVAGAGTGAATLTVSPPSLSFGNQSVGLTSAPQTVTLSNQSQTSLIVTSVTTSAPFAVSGLSGSTTLGPGEQLTLTVTFTPTTSGPATGSLTIMSTAANSPATVTLSGTAVQGPATISVSPSSLNFGSETLNNTSAALTVTVTNTSSGSTVIEINSVSVTPSEFKLQSGLFPLPLAPGDSTTFAVTFTPDSAQTFTGQLTVSDSASNSPAVVSLTGTGTNSTTIVNVTPSSLDFGDQPAGTESAPQTVTVSNGGTSAFTINSETTTSPFSVSVLNTQVTLDPGQLQNYPVTFAPASVGPASGTLSISTTAPSSPFIVSLSGTGVQAGMGNVGVTPSSLSFGSQTQGTSSAPQTVTITNTGTVSFDITGYGISAPFEAYGFTGRTTLQPGQSLSLNVVFTPESVNMLADNLAIFYAGMPDSVVGLSGIGTATNSLTITTPSPLPAATQGAAYLADLYASSGVSPFTWALASGSSLSPGLMLAPSGAISGTANSAVTGNLPVTIQVTDSGAPPATTTSSLTLPVGPATGALCNNISIDQAGTTNPVIPITDLGTGEYLGLPQGIGGLYGNGSNVRPPSDDAAGVSLANTIQPLDANGNPDVNGKYVLLSIGMSNATLEFGQFVRDADNDPTVDHQHLMIVNGAQSGWTASMIADPSAQFWSNITTILNSVGLTPNQVVAAWVLEADRDPTGTFPSDMTQLQSEFETIAQILLTKFPNIKLAYYSSREYAGYASVPLNPEPFAYESAFAVRGMVEDQINGNCSLNFDPNNASCSGLVMAPFLSWSAYYWANGLIPRSDGLAWSCQDFAADGTHPSVAGEQRVADQLLKFFKTDDTTTPWFLAH